MPTEPTPIRIVRPGSIPLEFDGWLIGEGNSRGRAIKTRRDSKERSVPSRMADRWTEVRIYRTESDRWVVEVVGRTVLPGERDLVTTTICDDPNCVQDAVKVQSTGVITTTARTALTQAAEADPRLAPALIERI